MKAKYVAVLVLVMLCFVGRTRTQAQTSQNHVTGINNAIIGRDHSELIADKDAYRMFFLAARVQNNSVEELVRQRAMFGFLNLSNDEFKQVRLILAQFQAAHNQLVQNFNSAKQKNPQAPQTHETLKPFIQQRDGLVAQTRTEIELVIGPNRALSLHNLIESEKQHMVIGVEDSGN